MSTLAASVRDERQTVAIQDAFLDLETIQRRVAAIKQSWSPETARARRLEGKRRREQLESLMLDLMTETSDSEESCDLAEHGFSLVG